MQPTVAEKQSKKNNNKNKKGATAPRVRYDTVQSVGEAQTVSNKNAGYVQYEYCAVTLFFVCLRFSPR